MTVGAGNISSLVQHAIEPGLGVGPHLVGEGVSGFYVQEDVPEVGKAVVVHRRDGVRRIGRSEVRGQLILFARARTGNLAANKCRNEPPAGRLELRSLPSPTMVAMTRSAQVVADPFVGRILLPN